MSSRWLVDLCVGCCAILLWPSPTGAAEGESSGFAPGALGMKVPVLISAASRDEYIGRLVAIRGTVSDSKIPRIAGIEVGLSDDKLRGQEAYAVGILARFVVTEADPTIANSGTGTFYTLYYDLGGKIAEARPLPSDQGKQKR